MAADPLRRLSRMQLQLAAAAAGARADVRPPRHAGRGAGRAGGARARGARRRGALREGLLRLRAGRAGAGGPRLRRPGRAHDGAGRRLRRRQDHHLQPAAAASGRPSAASSPSTGSRHRRAVARLPARQHRPRQPGRVPVRGHHPRQHQGRAAGRLRGGGRWRRRARPMPTQFIRSLPKGYDTQVGELGAPGLGRAAPAHRAGARVPQGRPDHPARRAHLGARQRDRARHPARAQGPHQGAARRW